jgi:hypothetical protein
MTKVRSTVVSWFGYNIDPKSRLAKKGNRIRMREFTRWTGWKNRNCELEDKILLSPQVEESRL